MSVFNSLLWHAYLAGDGLLSAAIATLPSSYLLGAAKKASEKRVPSSKTQSIATSGNIGAVIFALDLLSIPLSLLTSHIYPMIITLAYVGYTLFFERTSKINLKELGIEPSPAEIRATVNSVYIKPITNILTGNKEK